MIIMFDLFSDFFDNFDMFPVYREEKTCPKCGMTYSAVQKYGRLGCDKCYDTFREAIEESVKQIQQNSVHTGKIPQRCAGELRTKKKYEELKKKIALAVSKEDYEEAARLHKELKELGGEKA